MNAPVLRLPEPTLGLTLSGMWDDELERNILGAAMLGEPMPPWLAPTHFFAGQHGCIYEAVQSVGGNVAHVNAWLRESSPKFGPPVARSHELAAMCLEAEHARRMGWSFDFERLRELAKRRALVELFGRLVVQLRAGDDYHGLSHDEAIQAVRVHLKAVR